MFELVKKAITFFLILISTSSIVFSQDFTGIVIDEVSNQPVPFADIFFKELKTGTSTDINGVFKIHHAHPNKVQIQISFIGYNTIIQSIDLGALNNKTFYLKPNHIELEEVIVSIPTGKLQNENVVQVEQKKILELQQSATFTLAEALSQIAGVDQNSTGVGIGKPIIRGLSGNRIVTYAQGIRIENQQWGSEHGLGVGEVGIESVEVIKGPASLLYGSDALGGVLYFVDERYAKHNEIEGFAQSKFLSNTLGTINNVGLKLHSENVLLNIFGTYASHADYLTPINKRVLNSRFEEKNFKSSFGFHKQNWVSNTRYSFLQNSFGITKDATFTNAVTRTPLLPYQKINNHNLSFENTLYLKNSSVDLILGYTHNYRQEFEDSDTNAALIMKLQTKTYNLKWSSPVINDKIEFIIGSQGMHQTNKNEGEEILIPDANTVDFGGFSVMNVKLNELHLQAGIRYDYRQIESQKMTDEFGDILIDELRTEFNSVNYSAGLSYSKKATTFKANIASGFRAPNTSELLSDGVHEGNNRYEIGNPNLISEQATQIDFSFDYHHEHVEISINPYINNIQNYIFLSPTGDVINNAPVYEYIQSSATLMGGELGIHYHPHNIHWLHIESNLATVFGKDAWNNSLPLIPATNFNTTLKTVFSSKRKLSIKEIFVQNIYKLEQSRISSFETQTPSYSLINIGIKLEILTRNQPIEIGSGVNNLFNTNYIDHLSQFKEIGISNAGINVYFGIKIKFNQQLKNH